MLIYLVMAIVLVVRPAGLFPWQANDTDVHPQMSSLPAFFSFLRWCRLLWR
jgi:hypothetical protein